MAMASIKIASMIFLSMTSDPISVWGIRYVEKELATQVRIRLSLSSVGGIPVRTLTRRV